MALSEVLRARTLLVAKGPVLSLSTYLAAVVAAEALAAFGTPPGDLFLGMTIHVVLVFALLAHGAALSTSDERFSRLLTVFALIPLMRVLSLGLQFEFLSIVQSLLIVSVPLLAAAATMMLVLGISTRDVYLTWGRTGTLPWQAGVALSGFGLGAVEYFILLPDNPWVPALVLEQVLPAAIIIGLASGLAEELIFRGLFQPHAERVLGQGSGLLFAALLFAAMHIGFGSAADLLFVFAVGLYFGFVVQRTRSLVGVILAHGLANVTLYLLLPFAL